MSNQLFGGIHPILRSRAPGLLALGLACLGGLAITPAALAQTNAPAASNRWLLIVETSKSFRARTNEVAIIAASMVVSGMRGQARTGDTLGLWTFNDDLHDVRFPLQTLGPDANRKVAQRVHDYLQGQAYEYKGRLDKVMPEAMQLIKDSEFITVILLSTGTEKISGTPFDDKINAAFNEGQKERKKKGLPLATILRARHGQITDYGVMLAGEDFELPPLPPELRVTNAAAAKPAPAPKATPMAPFIMSGTKVLSASISNEVPAEAPKPQP